MNQGLNLFIYCCVSYCPLIFTFTGVVTKGENVVCGSTPWLGIIVAQQLGGAPSSFAFTFIIETKSKTDIKFIIFNY